MSSIKFMNSFSQSVKMFHAAELEVMLYKNNLAFVACRYQIAFGMRKLDFAACCADQPVHLCSLISAFVICLLVSLISKLASCKILIF